MKKKEGCANSQDKIAAGRQPLSTAVLGSKGQITLPKDIRDRLALKPGDRFRVAVKNDGTLTLDRDQAPPIDDAFGMLRHLAMRKRGGQRKSTRNGLNRFEESHCGYQRRWSLPSFKLGLLQIWSRFKPFGSGQIQPPRRDASMAADETSALLGARRKEMR
jgi:AbrB family looped-hinge helix DNA binding protein